MAAAQAAGYLEQTGLPSPDYLRRFRTHRAGLLARGDVLDYQGRVDTTWAISLERLRTVSPAAVALLEISAFLAPEPIPLSLFTEHPELLDEPLRSAAADPDALADAVGAMVGYSLARRHRGRLPSAPPGPGGHPRPDHPPDNGIIVARPPSRCWPPPTPATPTNPPTGPATRGSPRTSWPPARWATTTGAPPAPARHDRLSDEYGRPVRRGTGRGTARTVAAGPRSRPPRHPRRGRDLDDGAGRWSECDQAAAVGEDALRRARRVLGPDHPVTQRMAINYAFALTFVGRYAELAALEPGVGDRAARESPDTEPARAVAEFTLQRALRDLGPDHPMILAMSSLKAVALASSSLSDTTTTARSECADALRRAQSRLGPYHPTTLWLTGNLVLIFVLEGDAEGARILGERTLDRSRNHLGPNHPITLNSCAVVAFGMARNGDAEQARALAEDTVERCRNSLGPNHPSTLGAAAAMSISLARLGATEQAQTLRADVLARAQDRLGPDHPITRALRRELN